MVRFSSFCSVFYGSVVVLVGNLTHISLYSTCNFVVRNVLVLFLEGKLRCVILPSLYNVIVGISLVLVLEVKLMHVTFPSWCNGFDCNVVVPIGKIPQLSVHSHQILMLEIPFWLC